LLSEVSQIDASSDAVLHFSDTQTNIGVAGAPAAVAALVKSLFQVASLGLRMILDVCFDQRRVGASAYATGCTW
jgi:hypothetical protein